MFTETIKKAIQRFVGKIESHKDIDVVVYENPTEEIHDAATRDKSLMLHKFGQGGTNTARVPKRAEENYLFASRRFPAATTFVLPAPPHLAASDNLFFNIGVGGDGQAAGFAAGNNNYSELETNLQTASQVPQGQAFRMKQLGISFNAEALSGDIEQVLDAGSITFQKQANQWNLRQGPALFWPGGMGVSGMTDINGTESAHNGIADWKAARHLKIPRDIHNLENFNYVYRVPRPTRNTDGTNWTVSTFLIMRIWLWGLQMDRIPD